MTPLRTILFKKTNNLATLTIMAMLALIITRNSFAQINDMDEQIKKQLTAMKTSKNLPTLILKETYQGKGFRFLNTTTLDDNLWGKSLDNAHTVFKEAIGKTQNLDIVLVNSSEDAIRVDTTNLENPLILPINNTKSEKHNDNAVIAGIIRHEACHLWLINYAKNNGLANTPNTVGIPSYGHAQLPDWLDESVAVMCENAELEKSRVEDDSFRPIKMSQYLTMEHPVYAQIKPLIAAQKAAQKRGADAGPLVLTLESSDIEDDKIHYYTQSAYFKNFFIEKYGIKSLGNIVDDFIKGDSIEQSLSRHFDIRGVDALEKAFNNYIKSQK